MANHLDSRYEKTRRKVKLLEQFYLTYGREPKAREKYKGENIGYFLRNIRKGVITLETEEYLKLEKMGFRLISLDVKEEVHKKVELLKEYYLEFEREPNVNEVYKDVKIGMFLKNIYCNGVKLSTDDYKDLINLGFSFKTKTKRVKEKKIKALLAFYKKYERLPKQTESYKGENIGTFVMNIRSGKTSVPKEYLKEFKKIGVF